MRLIILILIIASFIAIPWDKAFAHKVNLFCYIESGKLEGEGYYSRGEPVRNALIDVYEKTTEKLLYEATTDKSGKFSVTLKGKGDLRVVMRAGQGHMTEFIVEDPDTGDAENEDIAREDIKSPGESPTAVKTVSGITAIFVIFIGLFMLKKGKAHNAF